jgi:CDP-diacylglycerol--glycerol-3-phosphate 3-phosphatidyltransferase
MKHNTKWGAVMTQSTVKNGPHILGMGLANVLTIGRIAIIPVLIGCLFLPMPLGAVLAFVVFVLASVTDFFDGWVARRYNQMTPLGKMLDPIADKLLIGVVLILLVALGVVAGVHVIAACAILFREIFISGMREFLAEKSIKVHVSQLAKWKTTVQMLALGAGLLVPVFAVLSPFALALLWLAAILTLYTGFEYFFKALPQLK